MGIIRFLDTTIVYPHRYNVRHFSAILDLRVGDHDHNTRNRNNLIPPFARVENIRLNFKYLFPVVWNEIPVESKELHSLSSFKKELRQFFLSHH